MSIKIKILSLFAATFFLDCAHTVQYSSEEIEKHLFVEKYSETTRNVRRVVRQINECHTDNVLEATWCQGNGRLAALQLALITQNENLLKSFGLEKKPNEFCTYNVFAYPEFGSLIVEISYHNIIAWDNSDIDVLRLDVARIPMSIYIDPDQFLSLNEMVELYKAIERHCNLFLTGFISDDSAKRVAEAVYVLMGQKGKKVTSIDYGGFTFLAQAADLLGYTNGIATPFEAAYLERNLHEILVTQNFKVPIGKKGVFVNLREFIKYCH